MFIFMFSEDIPEWEKELDAELKEYEVVDDGNNIMDDADLENEILQQIEAEANGSKWNHWVNFQNWSDTKGTRLQVNFLNKN